ncbi:holin [Bordetella phage vB_BbrM_PHB04]|uniref:Holin n=1 Tax=Bordetella phage vB_BbrM_PHB04 TaxID=2029657 RepID=A0A291LAU3_9CAUD|nr:holin [Bordetella phage vB_BbrM_PHB04]ATI15736.1 holin [Bordetella phage vB_BbrM_PHB04]
MNRLKALIDPSAWLLILPAVLYLFFFVDPAMVRTLLEWTSYALVLSGIAIVISRVIFPQIQLGDLMHDVMIGNRAAGTVVASVVLFVGIVVLSLVLWAKS